MKSYVSANFMFSVTAKPICDAARATYSLKNNASPVFEVYEVFSFRQSDKSILVYSSQFRGVIDELNQYHPLTIDLETAR